MKDYKEGRGCNLHLQVLGSGFPVLILHGLYGSGNEWLHIAKSLSLNYQVILPDLRNHGQSPHCNTHRFSSMLADLILLLELQQIEHLNIIGHSMGGVLAMHFLLKYPSKVNKLILVDVGCSGLSNSIQQKHLHTANIMLSLPLSDLTTRLELEAYLSAKLGDEILAKYLAKNILWSSDQHRYIWKINLSTIYQFLPEIMNKPEFTTISNKVNTVLLKGAKSPYVNESDLLNLQALFPLLKIHSISDAGHAVHLDNPSQFIEHTKQFLKQ